MNTHSVEHRISALVLVIAVSVIGVALPASASGKGKIVAPRHQALTIAFARSPVIGTSGSIPTC